MKTFAGRALIVNDAVKNMLTDDQWLLPEGIEQIYPDEAERLEVLRGRILKLLRSWGYRMVIPPMIEFLDSLLVGTGRDLELQTFKLIDQMTGRLIGIRADMTPQVARIDARMAEADQPRRLCYVGTVLHTHADHLERSRSPMQIGAELYGHAGTASDLEIIRLALEVLAVSGLGDIHLDLGHVGIYRGLVAHAGLDEGAESALFEILQRKDRVELNEFLGATMLEDTLKRSFSALLDANGPETVLQAARQSLNHSGEFVNHALDELIGIAAELRRLFPLLPINFDLAELRGYHYQTGVVFAAFVPGYGREVARGGRYDEIGRVFGRARPATGFSADLKVLLRLTATPGGQDNNGAIFAPTLSDQELDAVVRDLRAAGRVVVQELPGQTCDAGPMGCTHRLQNIQGIWTVIATD